MPKSGTKLLHREAPVILALTVAECAAALAMSRTRVYTAIRSGELASYTVGRSRRISVRAIEEYQQKLIAQQQDSLGGELAE